MECRFCGRYKPGKRFCSDECFRAYQENDHSHFPQLDRSAFNREVDRAQRCMEKLFRWSEDDQS